MAAKSLQFSNLPLEEVVVRAVLKQPPALTLTNYINLWSHLKDSFETVSDVQAVELWAANTITLPPPSLAGLDFSRNGIVLAIQANPVLAKWQRSSGVKYPRYPALREALREGYSSFRDAFGSDSSAVNIVNMTYTNLIVPPSNEDSTAYVLEFLEPGLLPACASGKPLHDLNFSWRQAESVDLRLTLQQIKMPIPTVGGDGTSTVEERAVFTLATIAGTHATTPDDPIADLDRMHDALQSFFESVISKRAREEWGYAGS